MSTKNYEQLGAFYLGRQFDIQAGAPTSELVLYDAKDLTTHAVCLGMTGSGKTGLCISLLEEAAIDHIPAIIIDPKGDLGNLLLTFPELRPADFEPWVDPATAARKGMDVAAFAADRAALWSQGLSSWDQDGARIARLQQAADMAIYTPGSSAGLPLSVLQSLNAPPAALRADREILLERSAAVVSGLLGLLGIDADPIQSREHILLSNLVNRAWEAGHDLDIATLIQQIQTPPFERLGVIDLESFFPSKARFQLAMSLNNLLASPQFAQWMTGEPLDVAKLLYTASGQPRLSILSIAHLSDAERMFFVTLLLNEVIAWMRTQPGTGSLRALLYMDEIFGYMPPTANPPSKQPLLTLLKQARAFGLGLVLATQNPVDLDYKGLSNAGTWFVGRLQQERDKMRLLDGLESVAGSAGATFNRAEMDRMISQLDTRVFLMNNVHDDGPTLFHTRWALSYLAGPLTRMQIGALMADRKAARPEPAHRPVPTPPPAVAAARPAGPAPLPAAPAAAVVLPDVPEDVPQRFIRPSDAVDAGATLVYQPALLGQARMHYVGKAHDLDDWKTVALLRYIDDNCELDPWGPAVELADTDPALMKRAERGAQYGHLPKCASRKTTYTKWQRAFKNHLYEQYALTMYACKAFKATSEPEESEAQFVVRVRQLAREQRDQAMEDLKQRYAPKLAALEERIRKADARVDKEQAQVKQAGYQTAVSFGATILGALFGRKKASVGTVGRAASTLRGAGRTAREKGDVSRAEDTRDALQEQLQDMEDTLQHDLDAVRAEAEIEPEIDTVTIAPRKSDMAIKSLTLAWVPFRSTAGGELEMAGELA